MIDINKGRDVSTSNVVGAYLNADMNDFFALKIEGIMVGFIVKADPEKYLKHVRIHNTKKELYVKMLKVIYGCIKSCLLWYNLFSETL